MTPYRIPPLAALLLCAAAMAGPAPVRAQAYGRPYSADELRWVNSTWHEDVAFAAVNGLLSVTAVGLARLIQGKPILGGLGWAAAGGVGGFLGKRLAAADVPASGLVGREVNALGASVVQNTVAGRGPAARLWLPLGPGFLIVNRGGARPLQWGLDLHALAWLGASMVDASKAFDWKRSLESGTAVFRTAMQGDNGWEGGGAIFLNEWADEPMSDVVAHERTHVLQGDFAQIVAGTPIEMRIRGQGKALEGRFVWITGLGRPAVMTAMGGQWLSRSVNPLEVEATYLEIRP